MSKSQNTQNKMTKVTEKEHYVQQQKRLQVVNRSKSRTGKSKEYINKLKKIGCPRVGCKCSQKCEDLYRTRSEKSKRLCSCDKEDIQDIRDEIKKESEVIVIEKLNH